MNKATEEQPMPKGTGEDVCNALLEDLTSEEFLESLSHLGIDTDGICVDLQSRIRVGEKEYGERLRTHNGRDPIIDAYQEILDSMLYLKQAILEGHPSSSYWKVELGRLSMLATVMHASLNKTLS